jgi:hypothetical protein
VADLVEALIGAGVRLTRVEPYAPTLEDLYFAVRGVTRPGAARVEGEVVVPRDDTPVHRGRLTSGNRLGRRFRDPFAASPEDGP